VGYGEAATAQEDGSARGATKFTRPIADEVRLTAAAAARLAAAQAAAAAVLDADGAENIPLPATGVGRSQARGPADAAGTATAAACGAGALPPAGTATRGSGAAIGSTVGDPSTDLNNGDRDSGDEAEEERAAAAAGARSRPRAKVKRCRRDWMPTAPMATHAPADHVPSEQAMRLAATLFQSSEAVTRLRKALVIGNAAVTNGWSWRRTRLSLPWWPRQVGTEKLWSQCVIVKNSLLRLANPKHPTTDGAVRVILPHINVARDSKLPLRVAEFLLLVEKSEKACADIMRYIYSITPTALPPKVTGVQRPTLSGLSGLRASPRIAPTPSEFARQHAEPRRPDHRFSGSPLRPAGWVARGSQPPTHATRMAPPEVPAPLPPDHPAAQLRSAGSTSSTVPAAAAAASKTAAELRAALVARAAAKKPRAPGSSSRASDTARGSAAAVVSDRSRSPASTTASPGERSRTAASPVPSAAPKLLTAPATVVAAARDATGPAPTRLGQAAAECSGVGARTAAPLPPKCGGAPTERNGAAPAVAAAVAAVSARSVVDVLSAPTTGAATSTSPSHSSDAGALVAPTPLATPPEPICSATTPSRSTSLPPAGGRST